LQKKELFMKTKFHIFLLILAVAAIPPCFSQGRSKGSDGTEISARGALGRVQAAPSGPLYEGDGGKNIRLAILAPQIQGDAPGYLPIYIQGLLNNNFGKYSAINLIDRQNLDRILSEQKIAASGSYSDKDLVSIGKLTNAQYFLFGTIQKLSGDRYSLQLAITDSSTGIRRANFMKDGTLTQLEGSGTLINEATADLLAQVGVRLTETGRQTLLAGNTSTVKAEAGLARGITAQAGGSEIEALFNFTQAITFDPSRVEALARLTTLSSTISGGTISQRIVNDIQARDTWLLAFKETVRFFDAHPPFEIIFDPNLIQIGETDYTKRTANIGMRIVLDPSKAGFDALNALLEGLEKTGRRTAWGFSGWPLSDINPKVSGTVVFGGKRSFSYKVDVALINERNKTIGNGRVTLTTERINFSAGDSIVTAPGSVFDVVNFPNIKAEDLTPTLTIVIRTVNGISSRNLNASGYMKIETGDVERRVSEHEAAERQAQEQRQRETAEQLAALKAAERQAQEQRQRQAVELQAQEQRRWDEASGLGRHTNYVTSVAFSPDGRQIVSGSGSAYNSHDNTVKLWDATSGRVIRTFSGHKDAVVSVAFSPDGRQIISGSGSAYNSHDNTIKLWDAATGREIRAFAGHTGRVNSVAFSPDGRQVLSGSDDKTIKLWDLASGRVILTFAGHTNVVYSVAFSPDGRQIVSGSSDKTVRLWDTASGRVIRTLSGHTSDVLSVAFSPDGKQVLSGSYDSAVKLWDVASGGVIKTFSGHKEAAKSVAFSSDGRLIVSGSRDKTVKLWDVATGRVVRTFSGHAEDVISVAFSPDGRQIVSGSEDKTVKLWDAATGRVIW